MVPRLTAARAPAGPACYHGGASFEAIGPRFDDLTRRHGVINADVLDAWFDPAPGVVRALSEHLPWLLRTSPPAHAEGLRAAVAAARGVPEGCLAVAAGSSSLIFLAMPLWLDAGSRALILEPTYGEYAHVLEHVVGCRVDRLALRRDRGFAVDLDALADALARGYDLAVVVNPNNPTGVHVPARDLIPVLAGAPRRTRIWVDEAYVDYCGPGESLESWACTAPNAVVCKSLSKVYALSGARAAYACGPADIVAELRARTPPWAVSLPAQVAGVAALADPGYYGARYRQTHALRDAMARAIGEAGAGLDLRCGSINALMAFLPKSGPAAAEVSARCRALGLFVRDCGVTSPSLGRHALRVAVKGEAEVTRIASILARCTG